MRWFRNACWFVQGCLSWWVASILWTEVCHIRVLPLNHPAMCLPKLTLTYFSIFFPHTIPNYLQSLLLRHTQNLLPEGLPWPSSGQGSALPLQGDTGSIADWETTIPHAVRCDLKNKNLLPEPKVALRKTNIFKEEFLTIFWNTPKRYDILASLECKKIKEWDIGKIKVVFHMGLVLNFKAVEFLTFNKSLRPSCVRGRLGKVWKHFIWAIWNANDLLK